jgi:hypothetical protein
VVRTRQRYGVSYATPRQCKDLWERYRTEYLPRKAPKSQHDDTKMVERYILPHLGGISGQCLSKSRIDLFLGGLIPSRCRGRQLARELT